MYEWLQDFQKLNDEIEYLQFNLDRNKVELKRWVSGDLSDIKLQHDSQGAKVEENIERIKSEIAFKKKQQSVLIKLVDTFKGLDHKILKLKYVDGQTLNTIAEQLNYSYSHIRKRHAALVRTIKFIKLYSETSREITGK